MKLQLNYIDGTQEIFYKAGGVLTPSSDLSSYPAEGLTAIIANDGSDSMTDINSISTYVDEYGETKQVGVPGFNRFTNLKLVKFLNLQQLTESMFENSTVESVILPECHAFVDVGYTMELSGGSHFKNSALKSLFIPFLDSQPNIENPTVFEGCSDLKEVVANFVSYDSGVYLFNILNVPNDARFTSPDRASQNNLCAYWDCITIEHNREYRHYPKQCLTDPQILQTYDITRIMSNAAYDFNEHIDWIYDSLCSNIDTGITALGPDALRSRALRGISMPWVTEISDYALNSNSLCIVGPVWHPMSQYYSSAVYLSALGQLTKLGSDVFSPDYDSYVTIDLYHFNRMVPQLRTIGSHCFERVQFVNDSELYFSSVNTMGDHTFDACGFDSLMNMSFSSLTEMYDDTFIGTSLSVKCIYLNNLRRIIHGYSDMNLFETVSVFIDPFNTEEDNGIFIDYDPSIGGVRTMNQYATYSSYYPIRNVIVRSDGRRIEAYAANIGSLPDPRALKNRLAFTSDNDVYKIYEIGFANYPFGNLTCVALPNLFRMPEIRGSYPQLITIDFSNRTELNMPELPSGYNNIPSLCAVYVPDTLYGKVMHTQGWSAISSHIRSSIPVQFKVTGPLSGDGWFSGTITDSIDTLMDQVSAYYTNQYITELSFCSMEDYEHNPYNRIVEPPLDQGYSAAWNFLTDIYFSEQGVDRDPYVAGGGTPSHMFGYLCNPVTVHVKGKEDGSLHLHPEYFQYSLPQSYSTLVIDWPYLNGRIDGLYFGGSNYNPLPYLRKISAHKCVSITNMQCWSTMESFQDFEIPFVRYIDGLHFEVPNLTSLFLEGVPDMNLYFTETISATTFDRCAFQSLNCRNLTTLGRSALLRNMPMITDLNFPLLANTDNDSEDILYCCSNLSCMWAPLVSTSPCLQNTKIESFRNYSPQFRFKPDSFSEIYTIDGTGTGNDSLQFRGVDITALQSFSNLSSARYPYGDDNIIGTQWPGDTIYNVIHKKIKPQVPSYPDHTPWLHLCLADDAQPYLSSVFLSCGEDSRLSNEYRAYIRLHEFEHASSKHDYQPRYTGSIYDLLNYNKMLTCDLQWFSK